MYLIVEERRRREIKIFGSLTLCFFESYNVNMMIKGKSMNLRNFEFEFFLLIKTNKLHLLGEKIFVYFSPKQ